MQQKNNKIHASIISEFRKLMKGKTIGTLTDEAGNKTAPVFVNNELEMPRLEHLLSTALDEYSDAKLEEVIERVEMKITTLRSKNYDGNDIKSACDFYSIDAENWIEIVRYEDGNLRGLKLILAIIHSMKGK